MSKTDQLKLDIISKIMMLTDEQLTEFIAYIQQEDEELARQLAPVVKDTLTHDLEIKEETDHEQT